MDERTGRFDGSDALNEGPSTEDRFRWLALIVLCIGQLMIVLDGTVVNVALPVIERDLHFSQASLAWVVNGYLVTFGGLLLLAGRIGDLVGQKRVFLFGLVLFTAASALCGFADSSGLLVAARFLQGIGAAFSSSMVLGILVTVFSDTGERTRAMSVYAFVANAGGSIGLLLGGTLTDLLSWHWIFFVNIPIGVAGVVLGAFLIVDRPGIGIHAGVDVTGALLVVIAPTIAIFAIVGASNAGWGSPRTLGLLAATVVLIACLVVVEPRVARPLIPLEVFQLRELRGANVVRFFHGLGMSTLFFLGALYLEEVVHLSPFATGAAYLPCNIVLGFFSLVLMTRLVRRFGAPILIMTGLCIIAVALFLLARAPLSGSYVGSVLPSIVLIGVGASCVFMPSVVMAMSGVRPDQSGLASGLTNVVLQIGSAFGVALVASVSTIVTRRDRASGAPLPGALLSGFHAGFLIGAAAALVAMTLSYFLLVRPPRARRLAMSEARAVALGTLPAGTLVIDGESIDIDPDPHPRQGA